MLKDVYDYFEDLGKKNLPRKKDNLICDGNRINNDSRYSKTLTIDDIKYYSKNINGEFSILDIASSRMYNAIGIANPPIYTIEAEGYKKTQLKLATQDVMSVKDLIFSIAYDAFSLKDVIDLYHYTKYKWEPIYDINIRNLFYKYMTPECFEQLVGLFLVDELRSENDRKKDNYFFYKSKDSDKYEGVIPIDNEMMEVLYFNSNKKSDFENFLATPYQTFNIFGSRDMGTFTNRMKDIKDLLEDGVLSKNQIELLKGAIDYDLPKEVKRICKNPYFKNYKKTAYDATSRLWEFHQKNLGKELEL